MRLCLVTDTYLPEVNGVTTVLAVMRRGLEARGVTVEVIAPRYPAAVPGETGVLRRASVPCPGYGQVRLSSPFGGDVFAALDRFRPDVVHVITEGPLGTIGRRWALRRGAGLVTSFHTDFPRYAERYFGRWSVGPAQWYLRRFHGPAAVVQTPSEQTAADLRLMGVPQVEVWGRGVDGALFLPGRRSAARRAARGVEDRFFVLHTGRLAKEKDLETLVGTFQRAHAALGDRAVFCVAGDGPRAAWVRSELPFAIHEGFIPRPVLADLYADADLFVFPSPTETCGLVALEAMASGLPVLASDEGGVLENLRDNENGRVLPAGDPQAFADAIVALAHDTRERQRLARGALAFAASRSWAHELDRLPGMYAHAVRARPRLVRESTSQGTAGMTDEALPSSLASPTPR